MSQPELACTTCFKKCKTFFALFKHYKYCHIGPNFSIICGIHGCLKKFKSLRCYQSHVKVKHCVIYEQYSTLSKTCSINANSTDFAHTSESSILATFEGVDNHTIVKDSYVNKVAETLIMCREDLKLPVTAINVLASSFKKLSTLNRYHSYNEIRKELLQSGIQQEQVDKFKSLNSASLLENCLDNFKDHRQLQSYVNEHFSFVKPVEIVLGHDINEKAETVMYVPILESLKCLLKEEEALAEVIQGHFSSDNIIRDYCDGKLFATNKLFSKKQPILQLNMYYDDFCSGNALSSRAVSMKISSFYFTLGNFHPKYRSKINNIFLAIICPYRVLKKYGIGQVLQPLIKDIQDLELNGICINGYEEAMKGTIAFFAADNLAAHSLGGFLEGFNAKRFCRICHIHRHDTDNTYREIYERRTSETYNHQSSLILNDENLRSVYGIKCSSPLNKLEYFHVSSGLPSDIAHDLFEGIIPDVLGQFITYAVQNDYFTIQYINERILSLPYASSDKANKPSTFSYTGNITAFKIKQTASQSWTLLRLFPALIGHKIPLNDNKYEVILHLLDVVEHTCMTEVTEARTEYLAYLIEVYLRKYKEFYSDHLKPKSHYLTHYPSMLREYGPLIYVFTLRFESKHLYFKELAQRSKNRKNLCQTLANRHQYKQSYVKNRLFNVLTYNAGTVVPLSSLDIQLRQGLVNAGLISSFAYQVHKIDTDGINLQEKDIVITKYNEHDLTIEFSQIQDIFISKEVYLSFRKLKVDGYLCHYHGYLVSRSTEIFIERLLAIKNTHSLAEYATTSGSLVFLKYLPSSTEGYKF